jgi:hypothetical protein
VLERPSVPVAKTAPVEVRQHAVCGLVDAYNVGAGSRCDNVDIHYRGRCASGCLRIADCIQQVQRGPLMKRAHLGRASASFDGRGSAKDESGAGIRRGAQDPQRGESDRGLCASILPAKIGLDTLYANSHGVRTDLAAVRWTLSPVLLRRPVAVHRSTGQLTARKREKSAVTADSRAMAEAA